MQNPHCETANNQKRRGAIAVLSSLCLVVVVAFLAFSVDFGYIVVAESELQNAADAGALSGARALHYGRNHAINAAVLWAEKNVAAGENVDLVSAEDVEIGVWNEDTATFTAIPADSKIVPNAVKVTCRRDTGRANALQLFFAPILGTNHANLSVSAIAQNKGGSCGGIMALENISLNDRQAGRAPYTDSYDSNLGDYHSATAGHNGDVCTNGLLTLKGSSHVNGDAKWWEQANTPSAFESQVTGELASLPDTIEFPPIDPGDAATNNNNSDLFGGGGGDDDDDDDDDDDVAVPILNNGAFELGTGGIADSVTLNPGNYYFSTMTVSSGSTVTVTGPTYIYVEGDIDLRHGSINNTTYKPMNLQIYPMGQNSSLHLPLFGELHAAIYTTTTDIYLGEQNESVTLEFYGKMVGRMIRIWDAALHVDESISFGALESGGEQIGRTGVTLVQ